MINICKQPRLAIKLETAAKHAEHDVWKMIPRLSGAQEHMPQLIEKTNSQLFKIFEKRGDLKWEMEQGPCSKEEETQDEEIWEELCTFGGARWKVLDIPPFDPQFSDELCDRFWSWAYEET